MTSLLNENNSQTWSNHENETNLSDDGCQQASQPVRKRTRATADQLSVLEDTFAVNVSPNSKLRKQLADQLQMSERSIQIWFQNRRAKVKHMQKRAQIQMHQASIRAQMYQYHQQQQTFGVQQQPPPVNYYFNPSAVNHQRLANTMPRAQSVDAVQHYHRQQQMLVHPAPPPPSQLSTFTSTPPPVMFYPGIEMSRQSMPPYDLNEMGSEFPEYLHGPPSPIQTLKASTIPTLIPVPDAGPTAMLASSNDMNGHLKKIKPENPPPEDLWISSPDSINDIHDKRGDTVDPSNLVISNDKDQHKLKDEAIDDEPKDLYLSSTTLTVGTWHRLRMNETDLVCVYRPDTRTFAWHIVDCGCHFKMEVAQDAVSSIEYVMSGDHDSLAEVHFDISEPPLFYMESTTVDSEEDGKKRRKSSITSTATPVWVQCSDFTEGKQASRFFRHTLKGAQHHLKQELLTLIQNHEETRRLVHFIESSPANPAPGYPIEYPEMYNNGYLNPSMYWSNNSNGPIPSNNTGAPNDDSLLSCGLYIS